jgi:DNA-binding MarR family transcriptional regulator
VNERVGAQAGPGLAEPALADLILAVAASGERALTSALLDVLEESNRSGKVLDATAEPIRRQALARMTGIDSTNLSKVTGPLVRAGWLKAAADATGVIYRRSIVVDILVRTRTLEEWRKYAAKRFGAALS